METQAQESNRIIKEIHSSFYSMDQETDTYLQRQIQAAYDESIKGSLEKTIKKYGFNNAKNSDIFDKALLESREELNDVLNECSVTYPGKKFITDEQIAQLCIKYNLLLTTPDRFIGEIPERNIQELNDFNPKGSEKKAFFDPKVFYKLCNFIREYEEKHYYMNKNLKKSIAMIYRSFMNHSNMDSILFSDNNKYIVHGVNEDKSITTTELGIQTAKKISEELSKKERNSVPILPLFSQTMIAATSDLLDIPKLGLIKNKRNELVLGLNSKQFKENFLPDPIVLHKVKRGAIIITAWGLESQDELVFNPIIN